MSFELDDETRFAVEEMEWALNGEPVNDWRTDNIIEYSDENLSSVIFINNDKKLTREDILEQLKSDWEKIKNGEIILYDDELLFLNHLIRDRWRQ